MFWLVEASSLAGSSCHMQGYLLTGKGMDALSPINLYKGGIFYEL